MKLKSDPKTGLLSYVIAFALLFVIAGDIYKTLNENTQPPPPPAQPAIQQPAAPTYKEIDFPHTVQKDNRRFFIVETKQDGSFYHVLYGWENLKAGNTKGYLGLQILCANKTMRFEGYGGETPEKARPKPDDYPREWKDVFGMYSETSPNFGDDERDIFNFVCNETK